ncbi:sclerostin-like [Anguilla rostrata]|uniref:sclerostin-like n=1 Tax=Anguilla rostrata TaxID=7938 RepID=UPI0030D1DDC9
MQVSLALVYSSSVLFLLQGCFTAVRGWRVFKNDATENIPDYTEEAQSPEEPLQLSNNTLNRPKQGVRSLGGRRFSSNSQQSYGSAELSCREVRLTRHVTDGQCRSAKPVRELVCAGQCVPAHLLPNSILRGKWWRGGGTEIRCVPAHSRVRRVQLHCPGGGRRTYKMRAVTSCKCKRYTRQHNQSEVRAPPRPHRNKKRARGNQDQSRNNSPETGNSY